MKIITMGKITNHNTNGLCSQKTCSQKEEYFYEFEIGTDVYFMVLCNKHYDAFNEQDEEKL